jgi:hypothetical protein
LIETGQEITNGRDKAVGVHDLDGIDTASIAIHEVGPRERQLTITGLPSHAGSPIRISIGGIGRKDLAPIVKGVGGVAKKTSHAVHGVGHIGLQSVRHVSGGIGRSGASRIGGIEHQDQIGIRYLGAVVPDVSDDRRALRTGKIDTYAARRDVSRVDADAETGAGGLPGRGVGRFARGHGHDLHAHDHEAVIKHSHHQNQEDGKNEGELDESLAFTPATRGPNLAK